MGELDRFLKNIGNIGLAIGAFFQGKTVNALEQQNVLRAQKQMQDDEKHNEIVKLTKASQRQTEAVIKLTIVLVVLTVYIIIVGVVQMILTDQMYSEMQKQTDIMESTQLPAQQTPASSGPESGNSTINEAGFQCNP